MKVIRSTVVDIKGQRYVEYDFSSAANVHDAEEFLTFRVAIGNEGHPRLPVALGEGLRAARNAIAAEMARLEALQPFDPE